MTPYAYVDSSALVKLVIEEVETSALQADIAARAGLVCSRLGAVELTRASRRRLSKRRFSTVSEVIDAVVWVDITPAILDEAATLERPGLRTLDAIHLATILSLDERELDVITYDTRLAAAVRQHGYHIVTP